MKATTVLALCMALAVASAAVTNQQVLACFNNLDVPSELDFALQYGVDCNKFHNSIANASQKDAEPNVALWTTCQNILSQKYHDSDAEDFYADVNSCLATGKAAFFLSASAPTNAEVKTCVSGVEVPDEIQFSFDYGVDCNKFHNGIFNSGTSTKPVTASNWTVCKKTLVSHFTDAEAQQFYAEMDSCVATGVVALSAAASAPTNAQVNTCVSGVEVPSEIQFSFDYGVDCNKFHNGIVNAATSTKAVTASNWTVCRKTLASHFTDAEAKQFYAEMDSCVANGVVSLSAAASAPTNAQVNACVSGVEVPDEIQFSFDYGVDCNKFHNGIVNAASSTKPVTANNWTVCRKTLASHFTDADAKEFYAEMDSCVSTGSSSAQSSLLEMFVNTIANFFPQL